MLWPSSVEILHVAEPGTPACTDQLTELFERWLSEWGSDDSRPVLIVSQCVAGGRQQKPSTMLRLRAGEAREPIARAAPCTSSTRSEHLGPPRNDVRRIGRW